MTEQVAGVAGCQSPRSSHEKLPPFDSSHVAVHEAFRERARIQPRAEAVDGVSYERLDAWAEQIATSLIEHGVPGGAPVALQMFAGPAHVAAVIGVLKAGCVLAPISTTDPVDRIAAVLGEVVPACLIVGRDREHDDLVNWWRTSTTHPVVAVSALEAPSVGVLSGGVTGDGRRETELDDPAYVVYTSGTTGRPKGILHSHRGLAHLVSWMGTEFHMGTSRRTAGWADTSYDACLVEIFATLVTGGTLCPVPRDTRFDASRLLAWISEHRVNLLQAVPSFGRELQFALDSAPTVPDLASLDHILFAGEPLPVDLVSSLDAAIPHARIVNLYGTSENILATWLDVKGSWSGTVPIGRPIPGCQVLILDRDGRRRPPGEVGVIVVCGPSLAIGYVGGAVQDNSRFSSVLVSGLDGVDREVRCYWTGDDGVMRDDGILEFRGRGDRQVKLRGIRIELDEIEAALTSHPTVVDCIIVPAAQRGELVQRYVAYVVPTSEAVSPAVWRAHLRRQMNDQLLPAVFIAMKALPRNAGGKVDISKLPPPERARRAGRTRRPRRARASAPHDEGKRCVLIRGEGLTIDDLYAVAVSGEAVELDEAQLKMAEETCGRVQRWGAEGHPIYGVTTGFGEMVLMSIPPKFETQLQENLLRSHAAGGGPLFDDEVVRAIQTARLNCLIKGYSGIGVDALKLMAEFLNRGIHPLVPEQGSLGASGDLAPLAHLALPLIATGRVRHGGAIRPAAEVLDEQGLSPVRLGYKDGLALINGTSGMTGVAAVALVKARRLLRIALWASAAFVQVMRGSTRAFDERGHVLKNHAGQSTVARVITEMLAGSALTREHEEVMDLVRQENSGSEDVKQVKDYLQNAYTLRCIPQILGPVLDSMVYCRRLVEEELNSCNDNPLIFESPETIFHGGHFHGQYVAMASDYLNIAVAQIGVLAERQLNRVLDPHLNSEHPAFLALGDEGLYSGLQGSQYLATSIASENLDLAAPASIKTIPSNGQNQDVVSMGLIAARKSLRLIENVSTIVSVLVAACYQAATITGIDQFGSPVRGLLELLASRTPGYRDDEGVAADFLATVRQTLADEKVDALLPVLDVGLPMEP